LIAEEEMGGGGMGLGGVCNGFGFGLGEGGWLWVEEKVDLIVRDAAVVWCCRGDCL